jgi:hypothetical protein
MERCIISTQIRTCRARAAARCPSARTSEHQDRMGEALSAGSQQAGSDALRCVSGVAGFKSGFARFK